MDVGETLEVYSPDAFAAWLEAHGGSTREIWLVIFKKASGKQRVSFAELLDVALCYGWIDGFTRSLDVETYVIRFTPRRKKSTWSEYNRTAVRRLLAAGRMTPAGKAVLPADLLVAPEAAPVPLPGGTPSG